MHYNIFFVVGCPPAVKLMSKFMDLRSNILIVAWFLSTHYTCHGIFVGPLPNERLIISGALAICQQWHWSQRSPTRRRHQLNDGLSVSNRAAFRSCVMDENCPINIGDLRCHHGGWFVGEMLRTAGSSAPRVMAMNFETNRLNFQARVIFSGIGLVRVDNSFNVYSTDVSTSHKCQQLDHLATALHIYILFRTSFDTTR